MHEIIKYFYSLRIIDNILRILNLARNQQMAISDLSARSIHITHAWVSVINCEVDLRTKNLPSCCCCCCCRRVSASTKESAEFEERCKGESGRSAALRRQYRCVSR